MVKFLSTTPNEYKESSSNFKIIYSLHDTKFGECLIALKSPENAVCYFHFINKTLGKGIDDLKSQFPNAELIQDQETTNKKLVEKIIAYDHEDITVYLIGTEFQVKVWKALTTIPRGETVHYDYIAAAVHSPKAIQSISKTIGSNRVAILIPCHRTISHSAKLAKFCWRTEKRPLLLKYEKDLPDSTEY